MKTRRASLLLSSLPTRIRPFSSLSLAQQIRKPQLTPRSGQFLPSVLPRIQQRNLIVTMRDHEDRPTLVKPPAIDPEKSSIENVLELTELSAIAPDLFTNTRPLWHPPGARGIYGGAVIAQCLAAAQETVPSDYAIHSMHCYFVLAGDVTIPILYHVEHVREGRSFMTRTVQARQRGKCIFTTTMSFSRENSGGKKTVNHALPIPNGISAPEDDASAENNLEKSDSPFEMRMNEVLNGDSAFPHEKRTRQWIRAKGRISDAGGHQAHLSALAYMSDSYFIGSLSRIHNLWRHGDPAKLNRTPSPSAPPEDLARDALWTAAWKKSAEQAGYGDDLTNSANRPMVGMMVSLDHTIYFHEPRKFRADEWMFTETSSPWAGDGRGLVIQSMFSNDGTLVATCVQEGMLRLKQDEPEKPKL